MSLYIRNAEANRLARELAARTGETLTDAVVVALRERLERLRDPTFEERLERATTIARRIGDLVRTANVTTDELFDEHGLTSVMVVDTSAARRCLCVNVEGALLFKGRDFSQADVMSTR